MSSLAHRFKAAYKAVLTHSKKTFKNWKIAIIVDIIHETEVDGAISILKIHAGKRRCPVACCDQYFG